jgi:hypothetical protein
VTERFFGSEREKSQQPSQTSLLELCVVDSSCRNIQPLLVPHHCACASNVTHVPHEDRLSITKTFACPLPVRRQNTRNHHTKRKVFLHDTLSTRHSWPMAHGRQDRERGGHTQRWHGVKPSNPDLEDDAFYLAWIRTKQKPDSETFFDDDPIVEPSHADAVRIVTMPSPRALQDAATTKSSSRPSQNKDASAS